MTRRRLLIFAGCFVGLLLLLALALPYVVSLDALRARVAATAEASLHRKVEIGRMRLRILTGLGASLEKLTVHNKDGFDTPALVSADRVSVRVAFWPLLSKRIEVRKLVLDGVTITVERNAEGKLNVDDFLSAGRRESAPASRAAAAALLVSRIEIDRGRAAFVDHKVSPGQTVTLAVDDLTGRLSDIGPSTPARFDLAARFLGDKERNLTLKGTLGPPPAAGPLGESPLAAEFAAKSLLLARLSPYVAAFQSNDPGSLSIDGNVKGKLLGALAINGRVALDPPPSAKMPAVDGTLALTLDWPKGTLVIGKSVFDIAELPLSVEGHVGKLHETPEVELRFATPGDVPLDHVTGLPGIAGRFPEGVKLAGKIRLDLQIQGSASDLEVRGTADASAFSVGKDGKPLLEAPSVQATVASRGTAPLSGRIVAPAGKLQTMPFQDLRSDWTWAKGALTLACSAGVFGGTLGTHLESDFGHPESPSHVTLDVRGVQAKPLVESTTSVRDVLSGTLNGTFSLSSRGLGWDSVTKTGRGKGHLSLSDADLRTVRLMPEAARALGALGTVAGFQVPPALESTKFSTLETSLELADGRVATPDLVLSGRDAAVTAQGSLGLDKTMAYEGRIVLGPSIVKSLGTAGRYVADSNGKLSLPFKATGPVSSPNVTIDESVVLELGRHALAREAQDRVGGAAGKALGTVLDSGGGKGASPIDVLQQLLAAPAPTATPTPRPR